MNAASTFNAHFVLTDGKEVSPQEFKTLIEKLGIKVTLPMSHGDAIVMEYQPEDAPTVHEFIPPHFMNEKPPKVKASKPQVKKKR